MRARTTYCTILASNYLPKAMALAESIRRHEGSDLHVLVIDAPVAADLPEVADVALLSTDFLGLPESEIHRLAAGYDLVEFATAVKPVLLRRLLDDADRAVYLDPDTYVVSPMRELPVDLADSPGGILLTPHFLEPVGQDEFASEGHLLYVGVYNLGFIAVDNRARDFLTWWWGHLQEECLFDLMSGLFVDQKWVDIGSVLFSGTAWRHPGYNVSVVNLHERPVRGSADDLTVGVGGASLRLFHFHAFDPDHPSELSTRFRRSTSQMREESDALDALCREYAGRVRHYREVIGEAPDYRYAKDFRRRALGRQLRRAYRADWHRHEAGLPSPFREADAVAYDAWRRTAWRPIARAIAGDAAKAARAAAPETVGRAQRLMPRFSRRLRDRFVDDLGAWG